MKIYMVSLFHRATINKLAPFYGPQCMYMCAVWLLTSDSNLVWLQQEQQENSSAHQELHWTTYIQAHEHSHVRSRPYWQSSAWRQCLENCSQQHQSTHWANRPIQLGQHQQRLGSRETQHVPVFHPARCWVLLPVEISHCKTSVTDITHCHMPQRW